LSSEAARRSAELLAGPPDHSAAIDRDARGSDSRSDSGLASADRRSGTPSASITRKRRLRGQARGRWIRPARGLRFSASGDKIFSWPRSGAGQDRLRRLVPDDFARSGGREWATQGDRDRAGPETIASSRPIAASRTTAEGPSSSSFAGGTFIFLLVRSAHARAGRVDRDPDQAGGRRLEARQRIAAAAQRFAEIPPRAPSSRRARRSPGRGS